MRIMRQAVMMLLFFSGVAAAHGQIGGDEPGGKPKTSARAPANKPMRLAGGIMQGRLLKKVDPVYPGNADVEGTVMLHVIIGKDGRVKSSQAVVGPAILQGAAIDAVKQWIYDPFLLNGEPVEVDTTVMVRFPHRPS